VELAKIDIPIVVGIVIYGILWLIMYSRQKIDGSVDMSKHSISLLSVVMTLVNAYFFNKKYFFIRKL